MEPWPPQQQVVGCIGINDVASHFCLQIADSAIEPDLPERGRTVRVEPRYNHVGGAQPASGDHEVDHDSQGHDAQSGALVDLNTSDNGGPAVPREVTRAIMHNPA